MPPLPLRPLRVLHASPTWFATESTVGGGERWVDNVMLALDAGAPEIVQAMVAIGTKSSTALRRSAIVRILPNERRDPSPMAAMSSQLWNEFDAFDIVHVHQSLTDFGAYACCAAASLGKTVLLTDLGGGRNPIMVQGGLAIGDGIVSISEYAHRAMAAASSGDLPQLVLSGPVDTEVFRPSEDPPHKPAAICVSRIMPHKGIDRIIRALPAGLKLRVVGRVYHEEYRALLGSLAVGKDVEFVHDASDEELVSLYQQSTVFVQGSCSRDVVRNDCLQDRVDGADDARGDGLRSSGRRVARWRVVARTRDGQSLRVCLLG